MRVVVRSRVRKGVLVRGRVLLDENADDEVSKEKHGANCSHVHENSNVHQRKQMRLDGPLDSKWLIS